MELPTAKINAIIKELCKMICLPAIPFKPFEKIAGKLRHAAIGLPVGRGICAPFNRTLAVHPKMVAPGKNGKVHGVFQDWKHLLLEMKSRPTHVNKLVLQKISDIGNMDASGIGAGGVLVSTSGAYHNMVWRVEWLAEISNQIMSKSNRKGTITNSDLEMNALLLQWLVLEQLAVTLHYSAIMRYDNNPTCSWATHMSPK